MPGFVLLEHDFARLSPEFQRELLQLFGIDGRGVEIKERETEGPARPGNPQWDANDGSPYPLSLGEAKDLVRGLSESSRNMLRCFCKVTETPLGSASLEELMRASGHADPENLRKAIPGITRRLRNVAGHPQAWIFDWRDSDWEWDATKKTWARGSYHIPQPAISMLCQAFGAEAGGR